MNNSTTPSQSTNHQLPQLDQFDDDDSIIIPYAEKQLYEDSERLFSQDDIFLEVRKDSSTSMFSST
jgi:hypothetical protein